MPIATGVFRFTPIESLNALANEIPLSLQRDKLSLQYYFKTKSLINNPANNHNLNNSDKIIVCPLFSLRVDNQLAKQGITRKAIRLSFRYRILLIVTATWMIKQPPVHLDFQMYLKATTPSNICRQEILRLLEEQ